MDTSDSDHLLDTDLTGVSTYTGYQVRYAYTGAVFSGLSFSYETQPTVTQDVTRTTGLDRGAVCCGRCS